MNFISPFLFLKKSTAPCRTVDVWSDCNHVWQPFEKTIQSVSSWKTKELGRRSRAAGLILLFVTHLHPRGTKRNQIGLYAHVHASNMKCLSTPIELGFADGFTREKSPQHSELQIRGSVKQQASREWIILNVYTCTHHFLLSDKHILSAWSLWRVPKDLSILSEGSRFTERIWKTVSAALSWKQ